MEKITLSSIKDNWGLRELSDKANIDFCISIFPDVYNSKLTNNKVIQEMLIHTNESTWRKFMTGNKVSSKDNRCGYVKLTKDLRKRLLNDTVITYLNPAHHPITPGESMVLNIRKYVRLTKPPIDKKHSLFSTVLSADTDNEILDAELREAFQKLLENGSENCISYAIFLLILIAIYQEDIQDLRKLYMSDAIDSIVQNSNEYLTIENYQKNTDTSLYSIFCDEKYMHEYNLYLYKPTYDRLYHSGKLIMKMEEDGSPTATLLLEDDYVTPSSGTKKHTKEYTGTPVLCKIEELVYIIFTNPDGLLAILCFRYDHFNLSEMYYRTALLITSYPKLRVPQVQKVAITLKQLRENDKSTVKGMLKMTDNQIVITKKQLDLFREEFAAYDWMEEFEHVFIPFMESHKCECYSFSESEMLSYSISELNEIDKLRILQALKVKSEAPNSINCKDPDFIHRIFKS